MSSETASQTKQGGKFFARGWLMVFIAFIIAIVTQGFGLYSFGMIKLSLTEVLNTSAAAVAGGFSFYTIAISLTGLIVGNLIDKIGLRKTLWISAVLYGGALCLISQITAVWQIYAIYIIMGIGSALGGAVVVTAIAANWFVKHRGLATGIIWSGMLPGSLTSTFIISEIGAAAGWQTAVCVLGVIAFAIIFIASFFLKWRPEDEGLLPDGEELSESELLDKQAREEAAKGKMIGLTRKQAILTMAFWFIFIAYGLNGFAEMGFFQNITGFLKFQGVDMTSIAAFMSFLSFAGVVGRLLTGVVVDKIGPKLAYLCINILGTIGLLLFLSGMVVDNVAMLYVAGFCFGVNLNSGIVCFSNIVARYFGAKHYGIIWGTVFLIKGFGDAIGTPTMAAVSESPMGWNMVFVICIVGMAAAVVLMLLAPKSKELEKMKEAQAKEEKAELPA